MPTYDYRCDACGHRLEVFQSMRESPKRKCPACGKSKLQRLIGAGGGIIFKGSGFYQTDYRSSSYQEAAKADGEKASAPSSDEKPSKAAEPPKSVEKKAEKKKGGSKGAGD